jgi:predicted GTPase
MIQLQRWQWITLAVPPIALLVTLLILAGIQLHAWGLSWVWGLVTISIVGWRFLLSQWTKPRQDNLEQQLAGVRSQLASTLTETAQKVPAAQVEAVLRQTLEASQSDAPLWEDWPTFLQRSKTLVSEIAYLYNPAVKYPLLNITVPQAYGLIRGTVDDLDRWIEVTAPTLNQMTVAQAYQTYETYQALETPLRRLWTVLDLGRWLWNPVAAAAKELGKPLGNQANQQLLVNFSQVLRETALTLLCRQAIALYGGESALNLEATLPASVQTQTLRELMESVESTEAVAAKPVNLLLVGRTGAGKSSLVNTLFRRELAEVDVLPSTDRVASYRWEAPNQETLIIWDSPGYEQVDRTDLRAEVLRQAAIADALILVAPALDPALESDITFLQDVIAQGYELPIFVVVTQVDVLRPLREWDPPYSWRTGDRLKEQNIRAAVAYRQEQMGTWANHVLPIVTASAANQREAWGIDELATQLVEEIAPAKAQRLARFLRSREARITAAIRLIDRYALQMSSSKGIVALVKTPLFAFLSTRFTGTPELGTLLAQAVPAEQVPVVASKLMLTYELASLLSEDEMPFRPGEVMKLWQALLYGSDRPPAQNAWAWGHILVEYWSQGLPGDALKTRFDYYLDQATNTPNPIQPLDPLE